jgi:hypothetical protein
MASATLSLGSAGYDLLEAITSSSSSDSQLSVKRSGNAHQIRSTQQDNTIDGLGLTTGLLEQSADDDWTRKAGSTATTQQTILNSSNVNIFANVSDFQAALGSNADTLNIFGNVSGSTIELDSSDTSGIFNDILNIQGSLLSTDANYGSVENEIYAGGGSDTIRIAGLAQNANIFLGLGNDSLVISGAATNVDIKGDEKDGLNGNDYIEFRAAATDVRVQSGGGGDTVIFSKGLDSSNSDLASNSTYSDDYSTPLSGLAAIELGSGKDSLVLGKGSYRDATFNTGSDADTVSIGGGDFTNVKFQLDGNWDTDSYGGNEENFDGGDKLTTAANSLFTSTEFSSNNSLGDTLVFGSGNIFDNTSFYLGQGNDSIVFGSGSTFNSATDSTISTGYGADTIVFGSSSSFNGNLTLDLGNDGFSDVVRFGVNNEFSPNTSEFRIIGADESDMLFVGAVAYTYNTNDGWMQAGYGSLSFKNLG